MPQQADRDRRGDLSIAVTIIAKCRAAMHSCAPPSVRAAVWRNSCGDVRFSAVLAQST
jgi:hypothetical protein